MDSQPEIEQPEQVELNDIGRLTMKMAKYGQNMSNNLHSTFANMTIQGWIRLIVIVGGYMLIRPYALKYLGKRQFESMEEQERKDRVEEEERAAKISPNQLRGEHGSVKLPDEDEDEYFEDEATSTATRWGQKARIRQRTMIKELLEREERRRQEEEDDKDIEDLLED